MSEHTQVSPDYLEQVQALESMSFYELVAGLSFAEKRDVLTKFIEEIADVDNMKPDQLTAFVDAKKNIQVLEEAEFSAYLEKRLKASTPAQIDSLTKLAMNARLQQLAAKM